MPSKDTEEQILYDSTYMGVLGVVKFIEKESRTEVTRNLNQGQTA